MPWGAILPYILQYGLPFAIELWKRVSSGANPTQADWDALMALTTQTAKTQMLAALKRAGIDPASPQGIALLAASA